MNTMRNQLGIWGALALLAVAVVVGRYQDRSATLETVALTEQSAENALDYARMRLWSDFLAARGEELPHASVPAPSLSEYGRFIAHFGLSADGDVATLYVVPRDTRPLGFDLVRVAYETADAGTEVRLHVALFEGGKITPAGTLRVTTDPDGALGCFSQTAERPQLWSLWPIMPQPLLP